MKKQIIAIFFIAFALAATLAACAPQKPGTDEPASTPASQGAVQVPNPITEYGTIEEAEAAAGFDVKLPSGIPDGYAISHIAVIAGITGGESQTKPGNEDISGVQSVDFGDPSVDLDNLPGAGVIGGEGGVKREPLVEITWSSSDGTITYRVAKGDGTDLSGDYNEYAESGTITVGAWEVQTRGNGYTVNVACWNADGFDYAIGAHIDGAGLSASELETIITSLQ